MQNLKELLTEHSVLFCKGECKEKHYTSLIYPSGLVVSCVFFVLTLLSYYIQWDHRTLIDKITVGYLINNLLAYICLIVR